MVGVDVYRDDLLRVLISDDGGRPGTNEPHVSLEIDRLSGRARSISYGPLNRTPRGVGWRLTRGDPGEGSCTRNTRL